MRRKEVVHAHALAYAHRHPAIHQNGRPLRVPQQSARPQYPEKNNHPLKVVVFVGLKRAGKGAAVNSGEERSILLDFVSSLRF